jgi:hypothetical protein
LKRAALGKPNKPSNQCPGTRYIEFTECKDTVTPNEYTIDVTKTDSVLTPFVGHLYIPVKESCSVKNVIPKGRKGGTPKSIEAMVAGCVNKTYDQCIVAGGKDSPKSFGSVCTGGAAYTFPFEGKLHLTYKWSQGKWEFQEEQGAKPAPPSSAVR